MKIARTLVDNQPTTIVSEDGVTFFPFTGSIPDADPRSWDRSHPISHPRLLAPIIPPLILAIGLNYRLHAKEFGHPIPSHPVVFLKNQLSVCGPDETIRIPSSARFVDYEVELAVVLKKNVCNLTAAEVPSAILGYTIANDVTARDWQKPELGGGQWCRAKSFDTFCPLGPWIVTPDELSDPNQLHIESRVNGQLRQNSNTADMIFPVFELIRFLSEDTTLPAGTVILTGTPSGVGAGLEPKQRLNAGDTVTLTIEGIGQLQNPVAHH
jgi:2-keto-4-pentenoate hydratase/2-oxohepta-3-ene-1,7-dioic acid hydratase in catechol pathway